MQYSQEDAQLAQQLDISPEQVVRLQAQAGLTRSKLENISESALRRTLLRLRHPDRPRARRAYLRQLQQNDEGIIPSDAIPNALKQLDSLRTRTVALPRIAGIPTGRQVIPRTLMPPPLAPTAGLTNGQSKWVPLGPGNIGGRTRAMVIHPTQPERMWAASVGGGIWRTADSGGQWEPVDDWMANLAVCTMVMDPTNPDIIYAGTGEGFDNQDAIRGAGIFMTQDGTTWTQLSATATPDFHYVNRLAISKSGRILLAATNAGIFRCDTTDLTIWQRTNITDLVTDIDFHPTDNRKAIAGGADNGTAYFSTDGGKTWRVATHPGVWDDRVEVTYALHDPSIVYTSINVGGGEIWRSTDGGKTYVKMKNMTVDENGNSILTSYLEAQGWYDNAIWAGDPTDADLVIVGGIDIWRSTDGGDTLTRVSNWREPQSIHADQHVFISHPKYDGITNQTLFVGNDGGVYHADDAQTVSETSGWSELINSYTVTQFFGGAGNHDSGVIIGGAQDNGTVSFHPAAGSEDWTEVNGGDGGFCASDPTDPQIFYGEYIHLNIFRITDGATSDNQWWERYISGQFWNPLIGDWDWKPFPFSIPDARDERALFIAPFVLDPNNPDRILASGVSLWRTNDAKTPNTNSSGPEWAAIKGSVGQRISAIAVAQGNSDIIWVGYEKGRVYRTENGTDNDLRWSRVDHSGARPLTAERLCTAIAIAPKDHKVVYVTFGGYASGNVWKTSNNGEEWTNIGTALPEAPVFSLTIHPRKSNFIYIGTDVGVLASEDGGATWSPTNEGPANCSVRQLFWMGETLICATHGRGMFQIDLSNL